jgi:hypothetical protein
MCGRESGDAGPRAESARRNKAGIGQ